MSSDLVLTVSDFVAVFNQTIEYAYPIVTIVGELANFRVSKNRWVYFDLKDENANVKFFGTVYQLSGPLEDGLMIQVTGTPRLHPLYGFSITVQSLQPVGEGSLRRAAALLEAKLRTEGLFDDSRKRSLPYPPKRVGLITSGESAAYHDFIKIMQERWGGVDIELADVQVQGEVAPGQIVAALDYFNTHENPADVIVITRGGGSAEDLAAFSTEQVTRAVAGSRVVTLVAIGHEVDMSLAELAADQRASTPSNAAQLLVPDKRHVLQQLNDAQVTLGTYLQRNVSDAQQLLKDSVGNLTTLVGQLLVDERQLLTLRQQVLSALSPMAALQRGYVLVRVGNKTLSSVKQLKKDQTVSVQFKDGQAGATITSIVLE
ncbi:MAG TPA: exodeoxyribonuclease VII large subunit [Verrucomicrobiae bacterium]|nr:exodeoxyribonuclease VII large subunit [Verrucomicrobiae bacterium]